ncbi:hypothetical protein CLG96_05165 [Sphingomonas oleivorans]|uniref:Uncharacterized protein n=1 Tax=Sphingomonas oleivorans TaxID=1735121 RepID=A0A2T5G2V8_9SPHN|nr:hypothetical protein CLG96_05165 [Sphingomonas oleivorans]
MLAKLDQADFAYREFDAPSSGTDYAWPLLDLVHRLIAAPSPAPSNPWHGEPDAAPRPAMAAPLPASRTLFTGYGAATPQASPPAPSAAQDLGALLASYSSKR